MEYRMGTLDSDEEFGVAHGVNLIQAALNMLHGSLDVEFKFVSAAHSRIQDETEDRVITDPSVNQLLDPQKLPRPRFAYIPKLRVTLVPRTGRLLVSKRDARIRLHAQHLWGLVLAQAETKAAFCGPTWLSRAEQVYGWLDDLRGRKVRVTTLPDVIWCELMTAALLLPYAQFNLSAPFSQRVECSDASMSGIGRAWATMPSDLVQRMAQLCDHPGTYTNLNLPFGLALNEEDKCPLRKLKLPRNLFHWHT
ncbi:unnamed protein product, partial [Durusdinium trenchii]